ASRKYNKGQVREDESHQPVQYAISAILRPLDVLAHEVLSLVPNGRCGSNILHTQRYPAVDSKLRWSR
ncbi:hypothetical protein BC943DRAFT_283240, partial [Umbelopsis sp. AD052]